MYRFIPPFGRSGTTLFKFIYVVVYVQVRLLTVLRIGFIPLVGLVQAFYILHFTCTMIFALDNDVSSTLKRRWFLLKTFLNVCKKYFIPDFYS